MIYLPQQVSLVDSVAVLTNFGSARMGQDEHNVDVMPEVYRAPETILGMDWDCKIDVWSLSVMVLWYVIISNYISMHTEVVQIWDLYQEERHFFGRKGELLDGEQHLAKIVFVMGPPPRSVSAVQREVPQILGQ